MIINTKQFYTPIRRDMYKHVHNVTVYIDIPTLMCDISQVSTVQTHYLFYQKPCNDLNDA